MCLLKDGPCSGCSRLYSTAPLLCFSWHVPIHPDCKLLCGSKPETFDGPLSAHRKPLWHQRHGCCIGSWEVTERMEQTICVWLLTHWPCEPQQGTFPLCAKISTSNFRYIPKRIEMESLEHVCTHIFIAAVFIRAKVWPEPPVFSLEEWVGWFTQWTIMHPWKRRKFWPMLHGTRMNLEHIMLSEISPTTKHSLWPMDMRFKVKITVMGTEWWFPGMRRRDLHATVQ